MFRILIIFHLILRFHNFQRHTQITIAHKFQKSEPYRCQSHPEIIHSSWTYFEFWPLPGGRLDPEQLFPSFHQLVIGIQIEVNGKLMLTERSFRIFSCFRFFSVYYAPVVAILLWIRCFPLIDHVQFLDGSPRRIVKCLVWFEQCFGHVRYGISDVSGSPGRMRLWLLQLLSVGREICSFLWKKLETGFANLV